MRTRHEVGANQHTALQPGCSVSARAGREQQHAPPPPRPRGRAPCCTVFSAGGPRAERGVSCQRGASKNMSRASTFGPTVQ